MKALSFHELFHKLPRDNRNKKASFFIYLFFLSLPLPSLCLLHIYILQSLAESKHGLAGLAVSEDAKRRIQDCALYVMLLSAAECFFSDSLTRNP